MCPDLCHLHPKRPEGCSSAQIFAVFPSVLVDPTGILLPLPKNPFHRRPLTTKSPNRIKSLQRRNLCAFKIPMSAGCTSVRYSCGHSSAEPHLPIFQGWSVPTPTPPSHPSRSLPHPGAAPVSPRVNLGAQLPESEEDAGQDGAAGSAVPGHVPCGSRLRMG